MSTTKVLITTDVEIWPDRWDRMGPGDFRASFRKYIFGDTPQGPYGLPFQMRVLDEHGLTGVFMVESLFACGMGIGPLEEIVGMIQERGHEVQMHAHPEWVDKFSPPILPDRHGHQFHEYERAEKRHLLSLARENLLQAGARGIEAFRAGNFGADNETLQVLGEIGIGIDSSYNYSYLDSTCRIQADGPIRQPRQMDSIWEVPMTCFRDGIGRSRHLQIGACSLGEMIRTLEGAYRNGDQTVVLLSHGFELLTPSKQRRDPVVVRRFRGLARYLDQHRDRFTTLGFSSLQLDPSADSTRGEGVKMPLTPTLYRYAEQIGRRTFR